MTKSRVSVADAEGAICLGIRKAYREYLRWTGDEGLDGAPEYLLTCAVARELADVDDDCYVTLEANVRETLACANVSLRGRPRSSLRVDGRADIVWWAAPEAGGHGVPKSIIEVKNYLAEPGGRLEQDVGRLRDSLALSMKGDGGLEFCCLAFWLGVGEPKRKIHDSPMAWLKFKSDRLLSAAQSSVARDGLLARLAQPKFYQGEYAGGASYAWAPGVLVIEKPAV